MEASVLEYIDFMLVKLNELAIEDISYSDYDQMTDWLAEIKKQVRKLEKKQEPMKPVKEQRPGGHNICCPSCGCEAVRPVEWCWKCGQRQDWTEGKNARD